jgi:glyoxylase-like metal-dependent hydrolase (beta-lactamase superfamily II)
MVDCGVLYEDAEARLAGALAPGERVEKLLITHGHPDHHGAAAWLAARHGCAVMCHAYDAPAVKGFASVIGERFSKWSQAAREHGASEALVARMAGHYAKIAGFGADLERVELIEGGGRVEAGGRTLEVVHVPGHTAGSLAFFDRKRKVLFSGDTVLPGITPNPFFDGISDHPSGPGPFLESVARLRALDVAVVLPGHGEPITDMARVLDGYERHHEARRAAIGAFLRRRGPATAMDAVEHLFPGAGPLDLWLAFAEVLGHLQYMETLGLASRTAGPAGRTSWKAAA